jgi:hypothetical protein
MAWFRRRTARPTLDREAFREDQQHLEQFVASRRGVEAYLEPRTTMTQATLMLVADDGEWTRRRVPSPDDASDWAHRVGIPFYDVALRGYPQRMRDFNARQKQSNRGLQGEIH